MDDQREELAKLGLITLGDNAPKQQHTERFFLDHGMWHDRLTGQHMYTEDMYYEKYRDGLLVGRELVLSEIYTLVENMRKSGTCSDTQLIDHLISEITQLGRTG